MSDRPDPIPLYTDTIEQWHDRADAARRAEAVRRIAEDRT